MEPRYAAAPESEFESYADFYRDSVYSEFDQEHRSGGSLGLTLMKVHQDPIDLIDPAVPDLVFMRTDNDLGDVLFDLGDGKAAARGTSGSITYYPAYTEARTRVTVAHSVTAMALEWRKLESVMASNGLGQSAFDPLAARMTSHSQASRLMDQIWQAASQAEPMTGLFLDGLTLQFLAIMADDVSIAPLGSDYVEDKRIARTIDYMLAHLSKPMTIAELSGVAALSPSQFSRVFKATTGHAVWAYVQQVRLERARRLLLQTKEPISQIAFACGFANQTHMTKLMRRYHGVTPGALRKSH